jgi:hypothetical protein
MMSISPAPVRRVHVDTQTDGDPLKAVPQKEHEWLQRLVGDWTCEIEASMEPESRPKNRRATSGCARWAELWVVCEGRGEMPGAGPVESVMTLGFDPAKGRFVGTFIASMMTNLWIYEGTLAGNVLTLATEGPSMAGDGTLAKYHDVIEILDNDRRTLTSSLVGTKQPFMTARYRRVR